MQLRSIAPAGIPGGSLAALAVLSCFGCGGADAGRPDADTPDAATPCLGAACPTPIIFDTDIGNDIDDVLALAMLHTYVQRGRVQLLAVTISKDNQWAAPFVDIVDTFYGHGGVPIGVVRDGATLADGPYLTGIVSSTDADGNTYPHDLRSGVDAEAAVAVQRRALASQPDGAVVFVVVGFSTNLARLLDSPPDEYSPLPGGELVARKCRLLSIMAGSFDGGDHREYNIRNDIASARQVFAQWPTPIVASGFEIGAGILYPGSSIEGDFLAFPRHPVVEAYELYDEMPYDRPTWDLTSVLQAVEPEGGYFTLSDPGRIEVADDAQTSWTAGNGEHRYITASAPVDAIVERFVTTVTMR